MKRYSTADSIGVSHLFVELFDAAQECDTTSVEQRPGAGYKKTPGK